VRRHHIALHEGALQITVNARTGEVTVWREGRNAYTRAKRAVEAAKALRAEGFAKEAVRGAVERTKTHVGTSDLSAAHWVEIAKRYLAEPAGRS
jgi:hypothetical protein